MPKMAEWLEGGKAGRWAEMFAKRSDMDQI